MEMAVGYSGGILPPPLKQFCLIWEGYATYDISDDIRKAIPLIGYGLVSG